ncbi:hypothetical protein ABLE94_24405 [Gordonia sp. VNK1]|uniref:hypothetical protein n=1 Tax=Gordonia oleivorans TaxID=3156618 RepID=UPI0032B57382
MPSDPPEANAENKSRPTADTEHDFATLDAYRSGDVTPVVDTRTVATALDISPTNAGRAITPLVDAGVLQEFTGFNRNRMWQANDVLGALDDFAARAARRGR